MAIGLGPETVHHIIAKTTGAQQEYAAAESDILFLLEEWFAQSPRGQLQMGGDPNSRTVTNHELWEELKAVAKGLDVPYRYDNTDKLGTHMVQYQQVIGRRFRLEKRKNLGPKKQRGWEITPLADADDSGGEEADSDAS